MRKFNRLDSLTAAALLLAGLIGACGSKAPPSDAAMGVVMDGRTPDMSADFPDGAPDGANEANPEVPDGSMGDATCRPDPTEEANRIERRLVYTAPGCEAQAMLVCERLLGDAAQAGKLLCGCDGKTFQASGSPEGVLLYSDRPYRFEGCCPGDEPMFFTNQCAQARDGGPY